MLKSKRKRKLAEEDQNLSFGAEEAPEPEVTYAPETSYEPAEESAVPDYGTSYNDTPAVSAPTTPMNSTNILSNDVELTGTIKFSDELILDGKIDGEIVSDNGLLTVGENASVKGEIKTKSVVVIGKVDGNLTAKDRCELRSQASINGDIRAGSLSIEEGASFVGQSSVGAAAVASASKAGSAPSKSSSTVSKSTPSSGSSGSSGSSDPSRS